MEPQSPYGTDFLSMHPVFASLPSLAQFCATLMQLPGLPPPAPTPPVPLPILILGHLFQASPNVLFPVLVLLVACLTPPWALCPPILILNLYGLLGPILVVRLFYFFFFIKWTQPRVF